MMDDVAFAQRLAAHSREHQQVFEIATRGAGPALARAAEIMSHTLMAGGKILACGNGGSATDAQHLASELVGRLERERPGLAALALSADGATLTALGNDYGFDAVFARQVHALAQSNDVLVVFSTSGVSPNIVAAVAAAHEREIAVIAFTGREGGAVRGALRSHDVELNVPHARTMRIQEVHRVWVHVLCDGLDNFLLGAQDEL